jgi:hypothetical protein
MNKSANAVFLLQLEMLKDENVNLLEKVCYVSYFYSNKFYESETRSVFVSY